MPELVHIAKLFKSDLLLEEEALMARLAAAAMQVQSRPLAISRFSGRFWDESRIRVEIEASTRPWEEAGVMLKANAVVGQGDISLGACEVTIGTGLYLFSGVLPAQRDEESGDQTRARQVFEQMATGLVQQLARQLGFLVNAAPAPIG